MHVGWICLLVLFFMHLVVGQVSADVSFGVSRGRTAFYRGEIVRLDVTCLNDTGEDFGPGRLVARIGEIEIGQSATPTLGRGAQVQRNIRIDATRVKSATDYPVVVEWRVGDRTVLSATRPMSIARRPNPDRMTVWLLPHGVYSSYIADFDESARNKIDWWAGIGFNNFCGSSLELWNYALSKGLTICFEPEGGLVAVTLKSDDPDIYFRDASGNIRTEGSSSVQRNLANP